MPTHMRHFESLGSNCEVGFVLHEAGVKDMTLFKWSLIEDCQYLVAAVEARFKGIYETHNLVPRGKTVVRDLQFGLCFHTALKIRKQKSVFEFAESEADMRSTLDRERRRISILAAAFLKNLATKNRMYVIRSNDELPRGMASRVLSTLNAVNANASLLVVKQAKPGKSPSEVAAIADGLYECRVDHLSTRGELDDINFGAWFETCRKAWELHAEVTGIVTEEVLKAVRAPTAVPEGFNAEAYLLAHPDVAAAGVPAEDHYLRHGWREGRALY